MSNVLEHLLKKRTRRGDEERILAWLQGATPDILNTTLAQVGLDRLMKALDNRLVGPNHRTALLALLCRERLDALTIANRAALVSVLQQGPTTNEDEKAIRDVIVGTRGMALTELKNAIDAGFEHRDLAQLVFSDIDKERLQEEVLEHISAEAASLPHRDLKVLTDIDDTIYANLKDRRYPKKTVYPGVRAFYDELDRGPVGDGRIGDIVFVTARPGERTGRIERATHGSLNAHGLNGTVLSGHALALLSNERIAARKFENVQKYARLFPEYDFVFTGDNGQGDVTFARRMRKAWPHLIRATFIHAVLPTSLKEREGFVTEKIFIFDTYVGAAAAAFREGLIGAQGLRRIGADSQAEFAEVKFQTAVQRETAHKLFERDLTTARALARNTAEVRPKA